MRLACRAAKALTKPRPGPPLVRSGLLLICLAFCIGVYADNVSCPNADLAQLPILGTDGLKQVDAEALAALENISASDPLWSYSNYLRAEIASLNHDPQTAFSLWRQMISNPEDPNSATRANSALTAAAFWRVLQAMDNAQELDTARVEEIVNLADAILNSRFARGLAGRGQLDMDLLPSLPQIEEASWRLLARVAWRNGLKDQAQHFFIEYLNLTVVDEFSGLDKELMDSLLESGLFSNERFLLFKAKRLIALKSFSKAREYAEKAYKTAKDVNIKAEAGLLLATHSRFEKPFEEIIGILNDVIEYAADPRLQFKALGLRATYNARAARARPSARDSLMQSFVDDLELIIAIAPSESSYTVEALYRLANHFLDIDFDKGLNYYKRLQQVKSQHHRMDSAYYIPAIALIHRAKSGDDKTAAKMLITLTEVRPDGPYTLGAFFWIARLQEQSGDLDKAKTAFYQLAERDPFQYFGLRARMHLEYGPDASRMIMPKTELLERFAELRRQALEQNDAALSGDPYGKRLLSASRCGLYENVLALDERLAELWPYRRIETLSLEELDSEGITPALVILLSLRLDSLAAAELADDPGNSLALAALAGTLNDWPLQVRLAAAAYNTKKDNGSEHVSSAYLVNAYPQAYLSQIAASARSNSVDPELLYAIIRNESRFYRSALSINEAIGLIQMQKKTFENLQDCGIGDLPRIPKAAYQYLLDADKAISLGGCWIRNELLQPMDGNVVHAIMTHNAGAPTVRAWLDSWDQRVLDDIELSIELIRYAQTRTFTRRTLTDYTLMTAFGTFSN